MQTDQAALGISREYLVKGMDNAIVSAYYSYMVDMAVLLGADEERAKRELMDSLNFEIALANISLPNEKRRNATALYNPMTVKDFQHKFPYTDWVEYFNVILKDTGIEIDENEVIIVSVPTFMEQLGPLLQNTPKRTMANYVMWRISGFSSFFLTENLRKRQLQYSTALSGKQEQEPRWKECVDITSGSLPISVGALYIRKYFKEDSKRAALDMVNGIKSVFVDILKKVDWMDEITRKSALDKVDSMVTHIGYPDELMDNNKIADYYKDLKFQPEDNYLNTILYMNQFGTTKAFKKLRQAVNKTDWITHSRPAVVNAFYSSIENSIRKYFKVNFCSVEILLIPHSLYRVPGRYSAGSILLIRTTKVHELWSNWFRYWSRDYARFRRPGTTVRQERKPCRLVAIRYQEGIPGEGPLHHRTIRQLH